MEGVGIIYLAVNSVNGKMYVGKTARELPTRIREHVSDSHNKRDVPFTGAIFKYGIEAFTFTVLETCYDLSELNALETMWIAVYDSHKPRGYNLTEGGDGALGLKRPDISLLNSKKIGALNPSFGRVYTPEERKKFGQPGELNARWGATISPELRKKISEGVMKAARNPETKAKLQRPKSEAHRKALSETRKRLFREDPAFAAKYASSKLPRSEETKRRVSEGLKRYFQLNPHPPISEQHKQKLSESKKAYWAKKRAS